MSPEELSASAPGRICLFGEHQDYFGLPIVAGAINLRITITGHPSGDRMFRLDLPDVGETDEFFPDRYLDYIKDRDYMRSVVNVLRRHGLKISFGWACRVRGTIPINSGTSSSSALVVAWNKFLLEAFEDRRRDQPEKIAELSFLAEVAEFREPGGKMDHYTSALGGIVSLHFGENLSVNRLKNPLREFVLADSMIRKNTTGTLGYIKGNVLKGLETVQKKLKDFTLGSPLGEEENTEIDRLDPEVRRLLLGTLMTRDLTAEGEKLFTSEDFDHHRFGELLSRQHAVLRDYIRISLPKIDRMIDASLEAGALGAKLNGSGQGGCIFAYAPQKAEETAEALRKLGATPYIIRIDQGARREQ